MIKKILAAAMVLSSATAFAQSQEPEKAKSLQELLRLVEQGRVGVAREQREREQRFAAEKANQQRLLNQAQSRKQQLERRSNELERVFERNEVRTTELMNLLDNRLGSLKELFGVLQQVTGDTRGQFQASLISAQFSDRDAFLTDLVLKVGSSSRLASMEEIERLWYELLREMTESGKVARFSTTVITADGEQVEEEVIRVGAFNIVGDGKYLQYTPETGNINRCWSSTCRVCTKAVPANQPWPNWPTPIFPNSIANTMNSLPSATRIWLSSIAGHRTCAWGTPT